MTIKELRKDNFKKLTIKINIFEKFFQPYLKKQFEFLEK